MLHGEARFRADVLQGLAERPRTLSPKYFYDERGSELFERICEQPEYYPTRTELGILNDRAPEICELIEPGAALLEFGSGSSRKTRLLLDRLPMLGAYFPVDISTSYLQQSSRALRERYPGLRVVPVHQDFTEEAFQVSSPLWQEAPQKLAFLPGSTLGNLEPADAAVFLARTRRLLGPGGRLLLGVDLLKPRELLEPAYNDAAGVTAAFNLNLLTRINRELGGDFEVSGFRHLAFFNDERERIEMHLVSVRDQQARIGEQVFEFGWGESIHTENSYKYSLESFARVAGEGGFSVSRVWTDPAGYFGVLLLTAAREARLPEEREEQLPRAA